MAMLLLLLLLLQCCYFRKQMSNPRGILGTLTLVASSFVQQPFLPVPLHLVPFSTSGVNTRVASFRSTDLLRSTIRSVTISRWRTRTKRVWA